MKVTNESSNNAIDSLIKDIHKLQEKNKQLEQQIQKMKCCGNCYNKKACSIKCDTCNDDYSEWKLKEW